MYVLYFARFFRVNICCNNNMYTFAQSSRQWTCKKILSDNYKVCFALLCNTERIKDCCLFIYNWRYWFNHAFSHTRLSRSIVNQGDRTLQCTLDREQKLQDCRTTRKPITKQIAVPFYQIESRLNIDLAVDIISSIDVPHCSLSTRSHALTSDLSGDARAPILAETRWPNDNKMITREYTGNYWNDNDENDESA